jgi:LmbE family N-acetylglucosaminyl deacetylase
MTTRTWWGMLALCCVFLAGHRLTAQSVSLAGAPADTGYNSGSVATIRATLRGGSGDVTGYAVFADIQYLGTTAVSSVQLDPQPDSKPGEARLAGEWLIPSAAPAGIYGVSLRVMDRSSEEVLAEQKIRGFAVYRKLVRIARLTLDKTFYSVGEPIQCEVVLENLTESDLKDLRVEFSSSNYPPISPFSAAGGSSVPPGKNAEPVVQVMREHLNLPAASAVTIPMMPVGTATFLPDQPVAGRGAGGPAGDAKLPSPEMDTYTVAVWSADRELLYDMQSTPPVIVRPLDRDLPKPYGRNFVHSYNSDIGFVKYRQFYPPGYVSPAITVDRTGTLYRPGEAMPVKLTVTNTSDEAWRGAHVEVRVTDAGGRQRGGSPNFVPADDYSPGQSRQATAVAWVVDQREAPGVYSLRFSVVDSQAETRAATSMEIAVNNLPASLLVVSPHEDDEYSYGGLIRAAVEAGIPVRVVILTGGDFSACAQYYSKPCGPNEAREFGLVRMEETAQALGHLGLAREKLIFLGLPEHGLGAIWSPHLEAAYPFLSVHLAADHAPYENVLLPNLPFARQPVLDLIKQIIADFRPAMIATTHPDDRDADHRATNWFVLKACQGLLGENKLDPTTVILADEAHAAGTSKPAPYRYEKLTVFVSGEASALKEEMRWLYQSQGGNMAEGQHLTFPELPREEQHLRIVNWREHPGWNE